MMIPWVISKDPSDFQAMVKERLDAAKGIGLPAGWVPDSTYRLLREEDNKSLGSLIYAMNYPFLCLMPAVISAMVSDHPKDSKDRYATRLFVLSLKKSAQESSHFPASLASWASTMTESSQFPASHASLGLYDA